jgi:hypothetical protein
MARLRVLVFLVFLLAIASFPLFSRIPFTKTSGIGPLGAPAVTQSKFQKFDVGVLAIFKGEALYLAEWLEYHLLIGVQHFWLASNDCLDEAASNATLLPYVQAGIVTLDRRFLCDQRFQRRAYNTIATELRELGVVTW